MSEETKLELRKPIMGLISMILGSLLILSFIVFSFIKTPDKNITPELGEISSAVFLMICFSLGIVGILKKSLMLQKIAIFVFSVFVFIESIFNILDFTDLIVKFYEPIYFLYLLPYFLIIGASIALPK